MLYNSDAELSNTDFGTHHAEACSGRHVRPAAHSEILSISFAVARTYGIDARDLERPSRGPYRIAFARQVAMYLAHVACGYSLTAVGAAFGRDRTTVAYACHQVEDARDDPELDRTLDLLEAIVVQLAKVSSAHAKHSGAVSAP